MVKNNKLFKILAVILIALTIVSLSGVVKAETPSLTIEANQPEGLDVGKITGVGGNILWIIQAVGMAAGIIIIAYMGIKYITSSPDGKAEIKKQAYV